MAAASCVSELNLMLSEDSIALPAMPLAKRLRCWSLNDARHESKLATSAPSSTARSPLRSLPWGKEDASSSSLERGGEVMTEDERELMDTAAVVGAVLLGGLRDSSALPFPSFASSKSSAASCGGARALARGCLYGERDDAGSIILLLLDVVLLLEVEAVVLAVSVSLSCACPRQSSRHPPIVLDAPLVLLPSGSENARARATGASSPEGRRPIFLLRYTTGPLGSLNLD